MNTFDFSYSRDFIEDRDSYVGGFLKDKYECKEDEKGEFIK